MTSTSTGHSYNEHLQNILDSGDPPSPDELPQRQQQQGTQLLAATLWAEYPGQNKFTFFGTTSDPGRAVAAPTALGLGMATVETAQDPDVAALATAHHEHRGSHLASASAQLYSQAGMAAFQDIDHDDTVMGSNKWLNLEESTSAMYRKSDLETFRFDVDCRRGPDTFFLFSILLCYYALIASGHFLSLLDRLVSRKWSQAPAILGLEWMQNHVASSVLHSKAYAWLQSAILALVQHWTMGAWQPNISKFFFDASIFKLFMDASCWAT